MLPSMVDDCVAWLYKALDTHTTPDLMERDRLDICRDMKNEFEKAYGGHWMVIMGRFNSWITSYNRNYIWFDLDDGESIEIFQSR